MTRLLQSDLEAEAITLEADAARIEQSLNEADMSEQSRAAAIKLFADSRRDVADKLRDAKRALSCLVPVGFS